MKVKPVGFGSSSPASPSTNASRTPKDKSPEILERKSPKSPFIPELQLPFIGMEAIGEVIAVGPGSTGRMVGDIVAYGGNPMGAYTEEQILPASAVVPLPSSIDLIITVSVMLKGMKAHCLLRRCFKVSSWNYCYLSHL